MNCRYKNPVVTEYKEVHGIDFTDIVGKFHEDSGIGLRFGSARYGIVDVEGKEEFVTRHFYYGIGRVGCVKNKNVCSTLEEVARRLDVNIDLLEEDDWVGDERTDYEKLNYV